MPLPQGWESQKWSFGKTSASKFTEFCVVLSPTTRRTTFTEESSLHQWRTCGMRTTYSRLTGVQVHIYLTVPPYERTETFSYMAHIKTELFLTAAYVYRPAGSQKTHSCPPSLTSTTINGIPSRAEYVNTVTSISSTTRNWNFVVLTAIQHFYETILMNIPQLRRTSFPFPFPSTQTKDWGPGEHSWCSNSL